MDAQRDGWRPGAPLRVELRRPKWIALAAAISLSLSFPSFGQPTDADRAAAKAAFEEGLELEKKGDYSAALAKFQKVGEFKMTPHVRFHIALCDEKLGHLVAALRGFELAEAEALKMGKDAQVVAEKAPERVEALRKRIASVRIEVKGRVLYSRVLLDGQPVPQKDFGNLVSVDPGVHTIEVETDGVTSQKRELNLPEKGYETITLEIVDPDKPEPTATASATVTAPPPPPPPPPPSKVPAFVMGAGGVASLVGAGVFYGLRVSALGEVDRLCPPSGGGDRVCPPETEGPLENARTFTITAGVLTGVGVAALAGAGAYWLVTQRKPAVQSPTSGRTAAKQMPVVAVGVTGTGIRIVGSF